MSIRLDGTTNNDTIVGGSEQEFIYGNDGNDSLVGNLSNDRLFGDLGNDTLDGSAGLDNLTGGTGDDLYYVDHLLDRTIERFNGGIDMIYASSSFNMPMYVENLTAIMTSNIKITGNGSANVIIGNVGNNNINGLGDNDTIDGANGNDYIEGQNGNDSLFGGSGDDTLSDYSGNDTIDGGEGNDLILTQFQDDFVIGGNGNDNIDTGNGNDTIIGGAGNDRFIFNSEGVFDAGYPTGFDLINDFTSGSDRLGVSKGTFTGLLSAIGTGLNNQADFATVVNDADVTGVGAPLVYNTTNGNLFYKQVLFADLVNTPVLTPADFIIYN